MHRGFKITAIILLVGIGALLLDRLLAFSLRQNANVKVAYVTGNDLDYDALFLGPCETSWGAMPSVIDSITGLNSYNLALDHSDYADNFLHLYLYLKHNEAPEYLFLYATPEALDTVANAFHSYRFAPFVRDSVVEATIATCDPDYARYSRIPLVRFGYYNRHLNFDAVQGFYHWLQGRKQAYYPTGYIPANTMLWSDHTTDFFELLDHEIEYQVNSRREKYFRKTLALARQHGIETIVYEAPLLQAYQEKQVNRAQLLEKIAEIAGEYEVPFWRFDTLSICKKEELFFTPLSMNPKGTERFNRVLGERIERYINQ